MAGLVVLSAVYLSTITPVLGKGEASTTWLSAAAGLKLLQPLRGVSGKLVAVFRVPGQALIPAPPPGLAALYEPDEGPAIVSATFEAPRLPGVYKVALEAQETHQGFEDLRLVTLVPFAVKKGGQIGSYSLGQWPYERGGAPSPAYANPAGFVEVTRENQHLRVSEHFTLGDFLSQDQPAVWPKYLLIDTRLVDKLELVVAELQAEGYPVTHLAIMSGFRSPRYNGMGDTSGRSSVSRHMYGDATDVFVDNDRDGWTDDLNRDGRVDIKDAEVVAQAAERVEARYPALVGGVGIYPATSAHGPFTHLDVRGRQARWRYAAGG